MSAVSAGIKAGALGEELEKCARRVALLGAPNSGKSALFNTLTGKSSTVANWPGVTVDLNIGELPGRREKICIIDLPGAYGLFPTSPEEEVTLEALLILNPDLVVALLDSTSPEGNLNLVIQLIEAVPDRVIVALTKHAISHSLGVHVDVEKLSQRLGVPVIPVSALEGEGLSELAETIAGYKARPARPLEVDYGLLKDDIERLARDATVREAAGKFMVSPRWLALQLVSNNAPLLGLLEKQGYRDLVERAGVAYREAMSRVGMQPELYLAERRLACAERVASDVVVRREPATGYWQRLADVVIHPVMGPVASLLGLLFTFTLVFVLNTGFPLNLILSHMGMETAAQLVESYSLASLLGEVFTYLSNLVHSNYSGPLAGLVADGIIGGIGFVLTFLPLIMIVYLFLGLLEDSGVATRMAISFHPLLYRFGLSGKSVFPLLLGMGCNVPAEYATKSLPEEERFRAVFAAPFIPCQARLAVIIAVTSVMVGGILAQSFAVTLVYAEAVAAALLTSFIVSRLVQPGIYGRTPYYQAKPELMMELPPVHKPHWRVVWWYVRDNTLHFLRKAGTVLFLLAIITWGLLSFGPNGYTEEVTQSYGAILGEAVGKVTGLIGVQGETQRVLGLALLDGLIAKEGVLTAIAISLGFGEESAQEAISSLGLTYPQAIAFLALITLYFPCIATLAAMRGVLKSWKLVLAYALYSILLAVVFATITYWVLSIAV